MRDRLLVVLIVLGLLILYMGIKFNVPAILSLALIGAGVFGMASGGDMIVTRRAHVPHSGGINPPAERHTGLAAQLWGVLFLVFGALLILFAIGIWLSPDRVTSLVERLLNSPLGRSSLLIGTGACLTSYGVIRLIARNAAFAQTGVTPLERVLSGIYFSALGVGLLAFGLLLILAPTALTALGHQVSALIQQLMAR